MIIDTRNHTQIVYFAKKPPEFFISAITGGPVSDRERDAALLFYENHKCVLIAKGSLTDEEIIKSVERENGVGPLMVNRNSESLHLMPSDVN